MWEEHRISCYTYKKYPGKDWPREMFKEQDVKLHNGEVVRMMLAEKRTKLSKKVNVREIRRLTKSGHQTAIITTDFIPETDCDCCYYVCQMVARELFQIHARTLWD